MNIDKKITESVILHIKQKLKFDNIHHNSPVCTSYESHQYIWHLISGTNGSYFYIHINGQKANR